jgi:hypothetical protein
MLNAFWRVAPSVRFNFLAIRPAGVFVRAIVFRSRTWADVHTRLFDPFLGIQVSPVCQKLGAYNPSILKKNAIICLG